MPISNVAPIMIAKAHQVLRRRLPFLMTINKDYADVPAGFQSTIPIDVPGDAVAAGNATASAFFDPSTKNTNTVNLSLSSWVEDGWFIKDDDVVNISKQSNFVPNLMTLSLENIALRVANDAALMTKSVFSAAGTAGTTPFATTTDLMADAGQLLDDKLCPQAGRIAIINSKAKAALLKLDSFKSFDKRGDVAALRDAELGRFLGFDWYMDQAVSLHTRGTLTGSPLINGAVAAAAQVMNIDAGALTGTVIPGDIFTVAGDTQQYVVTNSTTAAANAITGITFNPPSVAGFSDNAAVTFVATHRVNMAYHPNAFYMGSRRMSQSDHVRELMGLPAMSSDSNVMSEMVVPDPLTGLVLRQTIVRQKYRYVCNYDVMYGFQCVQPKMACRIMGEGV